MSGRTSQRFMREVGPGHWVIHCRACYDKRLYKKHFDNALQCHEWWRDHIKSATHLHNADPNAFSQRDADRQRMHAMYRSIFREMGLNYRDRH